MSPFIRIYLGRAVYIGHILTLVLALAALALSHGCKLKTPGPVESPAPAFHVFGSGGFR